MEQSYNLRSPAVKRLMREAMELREPTSEYCAKPLDDNLFEWHFTFRGPEDSEFQGGFYHGRIILPPDYPMKPPSIMLLNPNGRFELNKKICLSISGYHPESWQPSWSIRTAILAIIAFMPTKGEGAIGALDYTSEERKTLAKKSRSYSCSSCGCVSKLIPENTSEKSSQSDEKDRELAKQIVFAKPTDLSSKKPSVSQSSNTPATAPCDTNVESNASGNQVQPTTASTETPSESGDTLRQRPAAASQPTVTATPRMQTRSQTINRSESDTTSLVLIVVLSVAIAMLLFRRVDKMYNLSASFM